MRTAICLDYDNFSSGLRALSPDAAQRFIAEPDRWLRWLADVLGSTDGDRAGPHPGRPAGLLALHSYLNPKYFGQAEAGLRQAGFQVRRCPPVTAQGKTLADPGLMLQCLDDMHAHGPALEQVLLVSADGDFTPLLERARLWQRRTAILSAGHVAKSYAQAADLMIDLSDFLQDALGHALYRGRRSPGEPLSDAERVDLMGAARDEVLRRLRAAPGQRVNPGTLSHHLRSLLPDLVSTDWAGCGSATALVKALDIPDLSQDAQQRWVLRQTGDAAAESVSGPVGASAKVSAPAAPPVQGADRPRSGKAPAPIAAACAEPAQPSHTDLLAAAGLPLDLTPDHLSRLARKLWVHLGSGVPFDIGYTARHIHTALRLEGHGDIAPEHVHAFLQALVFGGFDMNRPQDNAQEVLRVLGEFQARTWALSQEGQVARAPT